jgi:hypothetical protein
MVTFIPLKILACYMEGLEQEPEQPSWSHIKKFARNRINMMRLWNTGKSRHNCNAAVFSINSEARYEAVQILKLRAISGKCCQKWLKALTL